MKPFNLEQAQAGKPICDAMGRPCRFIAYDSAPHVKYPLICRDWASKISGYRANGRATFGDTSPDDLFMSEATRKEGWIGLYRDKSTQEVYPGGPIVAHKTDVKNPDGTLISPVKLEWME